MKCRLTEGLLFLSLAANFSNASQQSVTYNLGNVIRVGSESSLADSNRVLFLSAQVALSIALAL